MNNLRELTPERVRHYRSVAFLSDGESHRLGVILYWSYHKQLRAEGKTELAIGAYAAGLRIMLALTATPSETHEDAMGKVEFLQRAGDWLGANPSGNGLNASPMVKAAAACESRRWKLDELPRDRGHREFTIEVDTDISPSLQEHFRKCGRAQRLNNILADIEAIHRDLPALHDDPE